MGITVSQTQVEMPKQYAKEIGVAERTRFIKMDAKKWLFRVRMALLTWFGPPKCPITRMTKDPSFSIQSAYPSLEAPLFDGLIQTACTDQ